MSLVHQMTSRGCPITVWTGLNIKIGEVQESCELWQYGLWSFQTVCTKLERFLPKNQHNQRNFENFENWTNSSLQK